MNAEDPASSAVTREEGAAGSGDAPTVLWHRSIDRAAQRRRWRNLALFYALPAGIAILGGLLFGGTGAFLGLLILLGLIGLLMAVWVVLLGFNERMNPTIVLENGSLAVGRRTVRVGDVERWSTVIAKASTSVGAPNQMSQTYKLAKVLFRVAVFQDGQRATRSDGGPAFEVVAFTWPSMSADELETIRVALEPYLPAPHVPLEELSTLGNGVQ